MCDLHHHAESIADINKPIHIDVTVAVGPAIIARDNADHDQSIAHAERIDAGAKPDAEQRDPVAHHRAERRLRHHDHDRETV